MTKVQDLPASAVDSARWVIYGAFILNGFSWGSFVPRIPDVKQIFELSNSTLGLTMLAGSLGILGALKPAGWLCARYGSRRIVLGATLVLAVAVVILGALINFAWFVASLFLMGVAAAAHDIGMNTHATTIEQASDRSLMNGFHAWFSVGALAGAGYGGLCSQFDVSPLTQLLVVSAIVLSTVPWLHSALLPSSVDRAVEGEHDEAPHQHPRIFYVLGLLGFLASVCEGSAADWGAILLRDTWHSTPFISSLPYILFSATMVIFRFNGDWVTDRFDREWVIRWGGLTAGGGLLVGVLLGRPLGICIGWALLGVGISVVIPSVFSAGSNIARTRFVGQLTPSAAVAIISGVSYSGFLVGPPMMGFIADAVTLRWAMLVPAMFAIVLGLSARVVKSN